MPVYYILLDGLAFLVAVVAVSAWGARGAAVSVLAAFPIGLLLTLTRHFALEQLPLSEALLRGAGHCVTWWFMAFPGIIIGWIVRTVMKRRTSTRDIVLSPKY